MIDYSNITTPNKSRIFPLFDYISTKETLHFFKARKLGVAMGFCAEKIDRTSGGVNEREIVICGNTDCISDWVWTIQHEIIHSILHDLVPTIAPKRNHVKEEFIIHALERPFRQRIVTSFYHFTHKLYKLEHRIYTNDHNI